MERPISIVWFERCYLGSLVVGLLNTVVSWNSTMEKLAAQPSSAQLGAGFMMTTLIVSLAIAIGITLLLWFLAARKRSVVAKWIITVFFVLGLLGFFGQVVMRTFPTGFAAVLMIVAWILNLLAVYQLFTPGAELWFGENKADQGGHVL